MVRISKIRKFRCDFIYKNFTALKNGVGQLKMFLDLIAPIETSQLERTILQSRIDSQ